MNAIVSIQQSENLPAQSEGATLLAVIGRLASDPNADVDKMERLMAMKERLDAKASEVAFNAALAEMQDQLPVIGERGNAAGRYTYALWEDINAAIKPVLKAHGFALSFRTNFADGIEVIGVLSHRAGHSIETSIKLPADASGNKNAVQAVASSVSYGKRYTAGALLNLTSHGEDDDAFAAVVERITDAQAATLRDMLEATGSNVAAFLKWLKVDSVESLPAKAYKVAFDALKAKERAK